MWANRRGYYLAWFCTHCGYLVKEDGQAGLWLPPADVEELVQAHGKKVGDLPSVQSGFGVVDLERLGEFAI